MCNGAVVMVMVVLVVFALGWPLDTAPLAAEVSDNNTYIRRQWFALCGWVLVIPRPFVRCV